MEQTWYQESETHRRRYNRCQARRMNGSGGSGGERAGKRLQSSSPSPPSDDDQARGRARHALGQRGAAAAGAAADAGLGAALWAMQQDAVFTDACVSAGGREFRCHRAVLCAGSGLFRAMFTGGLRETTAQTAQIHDVSAAAFAVVLRFLYTGEARFGDVPAAEAVLLAADRLDVAPLRARSAAWIRDNLTPRDCARVWGMAEQLCVASLAQRAREVACDHVLTLRHDEAFLLQLQPQHMLELLQSDFLCINSEDEAVELIRAWIQADAEARRALLAPLTLRIRFTAVSPGVAAELLQQLAADCERESRRAVGVAWSPADVPCQPLAPSRQSLLASTVVALSSFLGVPPPVSAVGGAGGGEQQAEASLAGGGGLGVGGDGLGGAGVGGAGWGGAGAVGDGEVGEAGPALIPPEWRRARKGCRARVFVVGGVCMCVCVCVLCVYVCVCYTCMDAYTHFYTHTLSHHFWYLPLNVRWYVCMHTHIHALVLSYLVALLPAYDGSSFLVLTVECTLDVYTL